MNDLLLNTLSSDINNIRLRFEQSIKTLQNLQIQMHHEFEELTKGINAGSSGTNSMREVSSVHTVNGDTTAYKSKTVDGVELYYKGIPLRNGTLMWAPCPENELDAAKEFVENGDSNFQEAALNPSFANSINGLLGGRHFLEEDDERETDADDDIDNNANDDSNADDDEENDPTFGEPTEDELNSLEDNEVVSENEEEHPARGGVFRRDANGNFVFARR